jgi:hypothetical protein
LIRGDAHTWCASLPRLTLRIGGFDLALSRVSAVLDSIPTGADFSPDQSERPPAPPRVEFVQQHRRWLALGLVCLSSLMIVLDSTIVNVALPAIQRELGFSPAGLAWIFNANCSRSVAACCWPGASPICSVDAGF